MARKTKKREQYAVLYSGYARASIVCDSLKEARRLAVARIQAHVCMGLSIVKIPDDMTFSPFDTVDESQFTVIARLHKIGEGLMWFTGDGVPELTHLPEDIRLLARLLFRGDPMVMDALRDVLAKGG